MVLWLGKGCLAMFQRKIRRELISHGEAVAKAVSVPIIIVTTVLGQIAVFILSSVGSVFPENDAFSSIVGTCAEIIAGLYGITLAGYTFFLSRIDALSASDMTLDYVVASIKNRFKSLIQYITFNVLMTLFTSIVLLYVPVPKQDDHIFFYRLFCNEFLLFMGFSVLLILYYSVLVIDPNCIEKEAAKLKKRLSRSLGKQGSVLDYITMYDEIERKCNAMLPCQVVSQIHENKGKRFEYTISLLQEQNLLSKQMLHDLIRVHRYYECMINTEPLTVSLEMCVLAKQVLTYLSEMGLQERGANHDRLYQR